ncbi:hypothetical protein H0X48_06805 [Candidatus Dependentiae bacterium]|nr:hypothetical protein [Candidatus Dependentiae bacterium]
MFIAQVIEALKGTPWWVYVLLVYLISRGIDALKTNTVPLYQLFILPIIFFALSLFSLAHMSDCKSLVLWISGLSVGSSIGWLLQRHTSISIDKKKGLVTLPGNSLMLVLILVIFSIKYFFGYVQATNALSQYTCLLANLNTLVSVTITGILVGRVACIYYKYKRLSTF